MSLHVAPGAAAARAGGTARVNQSEGFVCYVYTLASHI